MRESISFFLEQIRCGKLKDPLNNPITTSHRLPTTVQQITETMESIPTGNNTVNETDDDDESGDTTGKAGSKKRKRRTSGIVNVTLDESTPSSGGSAGGGEVDVEEEEGSEVVDGAMRPNQRQRM
jgi:hypothetical protein